MSPATSLRMRILNPWINRLSLNPILNYGIVVAIEALASSYVTDAYVDNREQAWPMRTPAPAVLDVVGCGDGEKIGGVDTQSCRSIPFIFFEFDN
jgi:hypothetical protein